MNDTTSDLLFRVLGVPSTLYSRKAPFPAKGFALLAWLTTTPGNRLTRQKAATLLWEDVAQPRALANFRQLLVRMQLQQSKELPLLDVTSASVGLGAGGLRSDLFRFLKVVDSDDVSTRVEGIENFQGELLDGTEFEGEQLNLWLLTERSNLREKLYREAAAVLDEITRFGVDINGDVGRIADSLLSAEPENAEIFRLVSNAYARCGDLEGIERTNRLMRAAMGKGAVATTQCSPSDIGTHSRNFAEATREQPSQKAQRTYLPRVAFMMPKSLGDHQTSKIVEAFVEDVANSFSRFKTFVVVSPHSTMRDFGDPKNGMQKKIRSDFTVQSFLLPDNQRISFNALEASSGETLWSAEYSLNLEDLHTTFRLLSKTVAANLVGKLERYLLEANRTIDSLSYVHVLRGQGLLKTCSLPMIRKARNEFRKSLAIDADLSIARARVAQSLQLEWLLLGGTDPHLLHRAKAEANAAIESDPSAGVGYWISAVIALYQRDYATSAAKFDEAETLSPNSPDLLIQHADALAHFGKPTEAWKRFQQAIDLNPLAPDIYWWAGASIAFKLAKYGEAVRICAEMADDEPALRIITASLALDGQVEAARQSAKRLLDVYPGMTAREIVRFQPDKNPESNLIFLEGLKIAGID